MVTTGVGGLPPHDGTIEEACIAAIIIDNEALARVAPILTAQDFFRDEHRWCYEAACALAARNEAITVPTLCHELDRAGHLEDVGGEPAIFTMVGNHYTAVGVESHARIVARDARYRRMIAAAGQIAQLAYKGGPDAAKILAEGMGLLGGLIERSDIGLQRLGELDVDEVEGMPWGIPPLDRYTMGLAPGQLTIIAGRTASGKSMLAAQVVRNCAEAGGKALIFTMEMGNGEYQRRMAHAISGVRKRFSNYGDPYTLVEKMRLDVASAQIAQWQVWSSDRSGVTVPIIAAAARLAQADGQITLIVVDYLQLMGLTDAEASEASNLKQITAALKSLAVEIGCHIVLVSQMNRAAHTEMRGKQNAQLKCIVTDESYPEPFVEGLMGGAVENDADLVVMLQRHVGDSCRRDNHMEICIAKNRNGVPGHGMAQEEYQFARLHFLTEAECFAIAGGEMEMGRRLRVDSGFLRDDWREQAEAEKVAASDVAPSNGWHGA
jgi:replicative DNA helicase